MSWKKYFKTYDGMPEKMPASTGTGYAGDADTKRYSSWLPEVYQGQPNRVQRYGQYDQMDLDSEVNTALDTIAEFSTLKNEQSKLPFHVEYNEDQTETENDVIQKSLRQWCAVNKLSKRMFRIFRNAVKSCRMQEAILSCAPLHPKMNGNNTTLSEKNARSTAVYPVALLITASAKPGNPI